MQRQPIASNPSITLGIGANCHIKSGALGGQLRSATFSEGIVHVMVSGTLVVRDEQVLDGGFPGKGTGDTSDSCPSGIENGVC